MSWRFVVPSLLCLAAVGCGQGLTAAAFQATTASTSAGPSGLRALRIQSANSTVVAGAAFNVTVSAVGADGDSLADYQGTLSLASSDTNAILPPSYVMSASDHGQHTFSVVLTTGGPQSVQATGLQSAMTASLQLAVEAGAPVRLAFTEYPRRAALETHYDFGLAALDAYGNQAPSFTGTVAFSSGDPLASVPQNYAFTAQDAGVHTFLGGVAFGVSGVRSLVATASAPSSISGASQNVLVDGQHVLPEHGALGYCEVQNQQVKCWGNNADGNLGVNDVLDRGSGPGQMGANLPIVASDHLVLTVAKGERHTCAARTNGGVECWGDNTDGKLGIDRDASVDYGTTAYPANVLMPLVQLPLPALTISAGYWHTCALLSDYTVRCWGWNGLGQLGQGNTIDIGTATGQIDPNTGTPAAVALGRPVIALSSGYAHTCALLDTFAVKCWGDNAAGQLGLGDTNNRGDAPGTMGAQLPTVDLGSNHYAVAIAAQANGTCVILDDYSVKCWGANEVGQLGLGDTQSRGATPHTMGDNLPPLDFQGYSVEFLASGYTHSCVILSDLNFTTHCWGSNQYGELGLGDTITRGSAPSQMGAQLPSVDVGTGLGSIALSLGNHSSCAYLTNNQTKCWGWDPNGQLGLGDTVSRGASASQMGDALPALQLF